MRTHSQPERDCEPCNLVNMVRGTWKLEVEVESRAARRDICGAVPKEAEPPVTFWSFSVELREGQDKEEEEKTWSYEGHLRHSVRTCAIALTLIVG